MLPASLLRSLAPRLAPTGPCTLAWSRRSMSSNIPSTADEDHPRLYVSSSTDPWFNLAFEDWLFKNSPPALPMLFLYQNAECVVLGRNQNPWKEINIPLLQERGIPFIRRRSGGGTVYHDLGNTNYSIMVPKDIFDRRPGAELISRALQSLGVPAQVNERSDITLEGSKMSRSSTLELILRRSLNNRRAYHHGTMLIDAKLSQLGAALKSGRVFSSNKGTDSVPSPVRNIASLHPHVTHGLFVDAVLDEFSRTYGDAGLGVVDVNPASVGAAGGKRAVEVPKEASELKDWTWQYGQTPEFSIEIDSPALTNGAKLAPTTAPRSALRQRATLTSKHGLIKSLSLTSLTSSDPLTSAALETFAGDLVGKRFGAPVPGQAGELYVGNRTTSGVERGVREWLSGGM